MDKVLIQISLLTPALNKRLFFYLYIFRDQVKMF